MMIVAGVTLLVVEPTVTGAVDRCEQPSDTACTAQAPELAHTHEREPVRAVMERATTMVNSGAPTGAVPPFVNNSMQAWDPALFRRRPTNVEQFGMPPALMVLANG